MQDLYTLSDEDKSFWFSFIENRIGLILPKIQQQHFVNRIVDKLKYYHLTSDQYYQKVRDSEIEWQMLINELTIPETSFFRHPASFDLVKSHLKEKVNQQIHIWSVGCSTGEESWSLAMLANEVTNKFRVMATDINEGSLDFAKKGTYQSRKVEVLPDLFLSKYFEPSDCLSNKLKTYNIQSFIKNHVSFVRYNLVEQRMLPFKGIDIIFCQNVLIYFRSFVQRDILNQLVNSLSIGGVLILAPAEARSWQHPDMERVSYPGTLAFRRIK